TSTTSSYTFKMFPSYFRFLSRRFTGASCFLSSAISLTFRKIYRILSAPGRGACRPAGSSPRVTAEPRLRTGSASRLNPDAGAVDVILRPRHKRAPEHRPVRSHVVVEAVGIHPGIGPHIGILAEIVPLSGDQMPAFRHKRPIL